MADAMWQDLVTALGEAGIAFDPGLTDAEIDAVERRHDFRFPPDLRDFLQAGLPRGDRFPDWRSGDQRTLQDRLGRPLDGLLFDVEHNGFWLDEWGPRPAALADAKRLAAELVDGAPRLIPVFSHRMLPDEPLEAGNPVLSVHQTDIIVYGLDLRDYFIREFLATKIDAVWPMPEKLPRVRFWDVERFQAVRWGPDGSCVYDNSDGLLP